MMVGTKPMLVVYNVGVAAGALTLGFTDAYRSVVGGSGGVYTLVGVHLANVVLNWHVMGTAGPSTHHLPSAVCVTFPACSWQRHA